MERFIIGTGRCGSTLLSRMLAVSPEMTSIFEFFNGLHGSGRFEPEPISGEELWEIITQPHAFVTMVTSRGHLVEEVAYPFRRSGVRYGPEDDLPWLLVATLPRLSEDPDALFEATREFVLALPRQPRAAHYRALFEWLTKRDGGTLWNERSGSGIDYTADVAAVYPDARFLHIHRQGEEAALSMREHAAFRLAVTLVFDLAPDLDLASALAHIRPVAGQPDPLASVLDRRPSAEHFGRFWSDQLMTGYQAVKNLRPEQYKEVAFEDLVARPKDVLREIATFFEMDPNRDGWVERAAGLVRGVPPARLSTLPEPEREALIETCRAGNRLVGRTSLGEEVGVAVRTRDASAAE